MSSHYLMPRARYSDQRLWYVVNYFHLDWGILQPQLTYEPLVQFVSSFGAVLYHKAICLWTIMPTAVSSKQRNGCEVEGWKGPKVGIFRLLFNPQQLFNFIRNLHYFSIGKEELMQKDMVRAQKNPESMTAEAEQFLLQRQMLGCKLTWMYVNGLALYIYLFLQNSIFIFFCIKVTQEITYTQE